ncbi:MAG: hypothetical protein WCK08_14240, partial [Betaproteobacteria bacterium]
MLVDTATGLEARHAKAKAKAVGKDLWIESPDLDQPLVLKDAAPQVEFFFSQAEPSAQAIGAAEAAPIEYGLGTNYAMTEPAGGAVKSDAGAGQAPTQAKSGSIFSGLETAGSGNVWALALGALALAAAGGGGGGGGSSTAAGGSGSPLPAGGTALDGYLAGATVSRVNGSGNTVVTDANGKYTGLTGTGPIKVVGGIDASTGMRFTGTLTAPEGATTVSPVTTLIQTIAGNNASAADVKAATEKVLTALNIPASFDVLKTDPVALAKNGDASAILAYKAGVMVATTLQVIAAGDSTQFENAAKSLATVLKDAPASAGTGATLINNTLSQVVTDFTKTLPSGTVVDGADLKSLSSALDSISSAKSVEDVASEQADVLFTAIDATPVSSAGFTFSAAVDTAGKMVTFGGSAKGPITVNVAADGSATFSRGGLTAAGAAVAKFADIAGFYDFTAGPGTSLLVNFSGTAADDILAINAGDAYTISLAGNLRAGQDAVHIKVDDIADSDGNFRVLKLDAQDLVGVERISFDFVDVKDKVLLTADSYLQNIATIEVAKGNADFRQVTIPAGTVFIVNSGLTLTLDQFLASESIASVTGLGRLTIQVPNNKTLSSADLDLVKTKLASITLVGFGTGETGFVSVERLSADGSSSTVLYRTAYTDADGKAVAAVSTDSVAASIVSEIQKDSASSLPKLTAQVSTLTGDVNTIKAGASTSFDTLKKVGDAIVSINGSITTLGNTYATDAELSTARSELSTAYTQAISTAVSGLKGTATTAGDTLGKLEALLGSLTGVVNTVKLNALSDYDTLKKIGDAIVSINGSINNLGNTYASDAELSTARSELSTAYTQAISTAVSGLKGTATTAGDTLGKLEALLGTLTGVVNTVKANALSDYDTLKKIGDAIVSINGSINNLGNTYASDAELSTARSELSTAYTQAISTAVSGLKGTATTAGDTLGKLESLLGTLTGVVNTIKADAPTAFDTLKKIGDAIVSINGSITNLGNTYATDAELSTARSELSTAYTQSISTAVSGLKGTATTAGDTLGKLEALLGTLTGVVNTIKADAPAAFDTLKKIGEAITSINTSINNLGNTYATDAELSTARSELSTAYTQAIGTAVSGLKGGATTAGDTLGKLETLLGTLTGVVNTIKAGALTNFDTLKKIGDEITKINISLASQGGNSAPDSGLAAAVNGLTTAYTQAISTAVSDLKGSATTAGDTLGKLEALLGTLTGVVDTVKLNALSEYDTLKKIGDAIVSINGSINNLGDTYATDAELSTARSELSTAYTQAISTAVSGLKGTATTAGDTLGKLEALLSTLTGVVNTIKAGALTNFDTLKKIGDAIVSINGSITNLGNTYATDAELSTARSELSTAYTQAISTAVSGLKGTATTSGDTLGKLETLLGTLTGVVNTVKANALSDYDTLKKIGDAIVSINGSITNLGNTYATDAELSTARSELSTAYTQAISTA